MTARSEASAPNDTTGAIWERIQATARRGTVEPYLVLVLVEDDDLKRWQKTRKYDTIHTCSKKNYDCTYLGDLRIALQEAP